MAALPLPAAILDDLISGSAMRSSKMAAGRGRAAIFHRHRNGGRKFFPRSWLTSFPAPPSWMVSSKMAAPYVASGGRRDSHEDVPSSERGGPSPKTSRRRLKLFFYFFTEIQKSIWSLASPNHSRNGWGSCPLATTAKSISLHVSTPRSMKRGVDFGKHLLYFFLTVLYNSLELL